ncbi:TIM-barrel domain-containing protein [Halothermothrix orenii]|uniref:Glycoside hydrolase family 31 n=1 Tax=Halothermothrix orenii (strain H 168 / OCM 544 / DSM 9562) TaxID=373903 RepID=B8D1Q1_HALOH|nr:TIM-barrel domain-containing protein [Halothermothrix orenii]ACL69128.1 glycoside hydrolase family 31 [Halothermothrix orenii H 168]
MHLDNYNVVFNILEGEVLHIQIQDKNNKSPFLRVTGGEKVLKSIDYHQVDSREIIPVSERYNLEINKDRESFKIFDKTRQKIVLESYDSFFRKVDEKQKGLSLSIKENELFTGLGQDVEGKLYIEDIERRCWNEWNGYDYLGSNSVPFYLSNQGYGLYLDTTYPSRFVFGKGEIQPKPIAHEVMAETPFDWEEKACVNAEDQLTILGWEEEQLDFYILLGDMAEIEQKYYQLTGKPSLLPKWSLGYIQCKNRYKSEEEILHIARKMREKGIPCDVIVIDWLWFKEFGDLYWDGENYSEKMAETIKKLKDMGIKILLAVHPFVDYSSKNYKELSEKGCLSKVPEGGRPYFDHTNPATKEAMWKFYQKLYDEGVAGWWTDMGEPESDLPGTQGYAGKREVYHNVYTLLWSKNIMEAQRENTGSRNFCLARTNALGIQNYNTAYWTGDIFATWEIYRRNIKALQTVSVSGQPYVCTDIGGFHTDERFTPELYVRWLQWGVFAGLFRVHGVKPENEPWSLGESNEKIIKKIIEFRYRFIPYIYEKMYQMQQNGEAFIRPLIYDYPQDEKAIEREYQYLFGDILVCPVVEPDVREIDVYLPAGKWYDFYKGTMYYGGETYKAYAPIDRIPLYVKDGSIILTTEPEEDVKDIYDKYQLLIYGEGSTTEYIYEDDGTSYGYEDGSYNLIKLEKKDNQLTVSTLQHKYKEENTNRELEIVYYKNNKKYTRTVDYTIGETINISLQEGKESNIQVVNVEMDVDVTHSEYNGDFYANLSIKNNLNEPQNLRIRIEKPDHYYVKAQIDLPESLDFSSNVKVEESAEYLYRKIQVEDTYTSVFPFKPFKDKMPQQEKIEVAIEDQRTGKVLDKKIITLGNGYLKNWRYAVSKYEEIDKDDLNFAPALDSNPWGYIYLYKYLNMQENGINPVDFIEIIQKIGYGYARVNILSPENKKAYLRIRADEGSTFYLNGEKIHENSRYTIEEDILIELEKGVNLLEANVQWKSPRPFTGREFGLSAQVLTLDKEIDETVKSF